MSPSISSPWAKVVAAVVQLLLCLLLLATPEQSLQSQSASHTSRQAVVNKKWQMRSEIFWEISAIKRWHYDLTMSCVNYAENTQCILTKYTENKFIGIPEILVRLIWTLCTAALVGSKQTRPLEWRLHASNISQRTAHSFKIDCMHCKTFLLSVAHNTTCKCMLTSSRSCPR